MCIDDAFFFFYRKLLKKMLYEVKLSLNKSALLHIITDK